MDPNIIFDAEPKAPINDDILTLELGSWEGPLDLLLALARNQKVDLREIGRAHV